MQMKREKEGKNVPKSGGSEVQSNMEEHSQMSPPSSHVGPAVPSHEDQTKALLSAVPPTREGVHSCHSIDLQLLL